MASEPQPPKRVPRSLVRDLVNTVRGFGRILILAHNDPDSDAIASAAGLAFVLKKRANVDSDAAFGGVIARVQNRAMIRLLDLRIFSLASLTLSDYDACALVDCQPTTIRSPVPEKLDVKVIIDHHPLAGPVPEDAFVDIDEDYGATSTIVAEYAGGARLRLPKPLATALLYGIKSDTRDLGGKSCKMDVFQYTNLFKRADIQLLAQIEHAKVSREYFQVIGSAIGNARLYGGSVLVSPLGEISNADIIAEAADYFLRLDGVTLVLCTGLLKGDIVMSARASSSKSDVGELLQQAVGEAGSAGGHATMAAGQVPAGKLSREACLALRDRIIADFVRLAGEDAQESELLFERSGGVLERP